MLRNSQGILEVIGFSIAFLTFVYLMVYLLLTGWRKPRVLVIDDVRVIEADYTARTFEEGIAALKVGGPWALLYLDHDLGDPDPSKTGYDIINFLEANPKLLPGRIVLVTSNPVGRKKMQVVIDKLYGRDYQ